MNKEIKESIIRYILMIACTLVIGLLALAGVWAICVAVAELQPIGFILSMLCIIILTCVALD